MDRSAPLQAVWTCDLSTVSHFLSGPRSIDDELIARWIPALSLLRWKPIRPDDSSAPSTPHALYALFRCILAPGGLHRGVYGRALFPADPDDSRRPRAGTARSLVNLIVGGHLERAVELARRRYLAAGWKTIAVSEDDLHADPLRLAAALLIPVPPQALASLVERQWILKPKQH